ncbi:hypothetical protein HDV57DRAFT_231809 [Trichoderma longibrachiatum]
MMMTLATHEDITRQKASRATLKPKRQMSSHNRLPDVPFGRAVGSFSLVRSTCTSSYPEILWRDLDGKESTSLMPPSLVPSIGFVSSCHRSRNSISRIRSSRFCFNSSLCSLCSPLVLMRHDSSSQSCGLQEASTIRPT